MTIGHLSFDRTKADNPQQEKPTSRLVIFVGPPKCATSSIEQFFAQHAPAGGGGGVDASFSSLRRIQTGSSAFQNWTWPRIQNHADGNGLKMLVIHRQNQTKQQDIQKEILEAKETTPNLFLGSEFLVNFQQTKVIHDMLTWNSPTPWPRPEILVNYRTPRSDQLISLYKQKVRGKKPFRRIAFDTWFCQSEKDIIYYALDVVMNPLRLVLESKQNGWKSLLMDMSGVVRNGRDISHAIACDVLGVPCYRGWVKGSQNEIIKSNEKPGGIELPLATLESMEDLLRQRDCWFQPRLELDGEVLIFYRDTLWEGCHEQDMSVDEQLQNTSYLILMLRNTLNCPSSDSNVKNSKLIVQATYPSSTANTNRTLLLHSTRRLEGTEPIAGRFPSKLSPNDFGRGQRMDFGFDLAFVSCLQTFLLLLILRRHKFLPGYGCL